jgi:hypothetical protein
MGHLALDQAVHRGHYGKWNPQAASPNKMKEATMCQCHDIYEPVPYRPAIPQPTVVTQCHDVCADVDLDSPDQKGHLEPELFAERETARV